ncbi:MAG: hypothetical protein AABX70_05125 [Nanoarchaeota archaeon]
MKFLGILLMCLLLMGMVVIAEEERLPKQLQKQNEVLHRSKTFGGFGSQVVKSTGGSSIKRVWDKRKGENKGETEVKEVGTKETPKYASYGIQAGIYRGSPYAQGGFGTGTKTYGLSKQKMKSFVKKEIAPAPVAKVAAGSIVSEPPAPEPSSEPSTA